MAERITATFGAGCFWGVEARFARIPGVEQTAVGYMGGELPKPSYQQVCQGDSGHTEVVQLHFDPGLIGYPELLEAFFSMHDPTQLHRQGPDLGYQYRSVIFTHDDEQARQAREIKAAQAGRHRASVVTAIEPAAQFWRAEEYHQQYLAKNGGSCQV